LRSEVIPRIMNELLCSSRIIFCSLDELPQTLPKKHFLFLDDAHMVSEPKIFQALRLQPERMVLYGNSSLTSSNLSLFLRLVENDGYIMRMSSYHKEDMLMKKVNETLF
jgi:hypothetical protein